MKTATPQLPFADAEMKGLHAKPARPAPKADPAPGKTEAHHVLAALILLRQVMEDTGHYGAQFDQQDTFCSLRRWLLRRQKPIAQLLAYGARCGSLSVLCLGKGSAESLFQLVRQPSLLAAMKMKESERTAVLERAINELRSGIRYAQSRCPA